MSIEIYTSGRQSGKTYRTVRWFCMNPNNHMILTINEQEAKRVRREITEFIGGDEKAQALTYKRLKLDRAVIPWRRANNLRGLPSRNVRIDNADMVLQDLVGIHNRLDGVTWNA